MVKINPSKPNNQTQSQMNKTRVLRQQDGVSKMSFHKRLNMQRRRIETLLSKNEALEEKDKELLLNLNTCNLENANLKKEVFHWQRLYHEALITNNTYKVKVADIIEALTKCNNDFGDIFPNMLTFSKSVTNTKMRIIDMLNSLTLSGDNCLPRQFGNSGKASDSSQQKNGTPMKQRVGPMVKGMLITKPKIMLERLMLPQPQNQEADISPMSPIEVVGQLTPIPEERERETEVSLNHISMRPRRKLGSKWHARRQEKIEKERERERVNQSSAYDSDSSDTGSNPPPINHMEPVVRFKDVSRLLQNSSLIKVDSPARSVEGEMNARPLRATEDPLEGTSWMFANNRNRHSSFQPLRTPLYNMESSDEDEENEIAAQNRVTGLSPTNSITRKSETFTLPLQSRTSILPTENTCNSITVSPTVEPDSTNNVESPDTNNFSLTYMSDDRCRLSNSSSTSAKRTVISSRNTSTENTLTNQSECEERMSIVANTVTVRLPKVPDNSLFNNTFEVSDSRRKSSFCDNCTPLHNSCEIPGKRIRKPKNQLYPGEDSPEESKNKPEKISKLKIKKKSHEKQVVKKKRPSKETNKDQNDDSCSPGSSKKSKKSVKSVKELVEPDKTENLTKSKQSTKKKSLSTSRVPSIGETKSSLVPPRKSIKLVKEIGGTNKAVKNKKSTLDKNVAPPRNSSTGGPKSSLSSESANRPRRNRTNICYKESPLITKLRRPSED